MEPHEIRLRGGWECTPADDRASEPARLALPARGSLLPAGRLRLARRFSRPPRVAEARVTLRFSRCPGIHSATINGRPIGPTSPGLSEFDLDLGILEPRNRLAIEAEPPRNDDEWGAISLVFEPGPEDGLG